MEDRVAGRQVRIGQFVECLSCRIEIVSTRVKADDGAVNEAVEDETAAEGLGVEGWDGVGTPVGGGDGFYK